MSNPFARLFGKQKINEEKQMRGYVLGINLRLAEPSAGSEGGLAAIVNALNAPMTDTVEAYRIGKHKSGNPFVYEIDVRLVKFNTAGVTKYVIQANVAVTRMTESYELPMLKPEIEKVGLTVLKSQGNTGTDPYYTGLGGNELRLLSIPGSQTINPALVLEGLEQFMQKLEHVLGKFCYAGELHTKLDRAGRAYSGELERNGKTEMFMLGAQVAKIGGTGIGGEYSQVLNLQQKR